MPVFVDPILLDSVDGVSYVVSDEGVLCAIGTTNWKQFTEENRAPKVADTGSIIGRPLQDFIAGDKVSATYDYFLQQLRSGAMTRIALSYRCDSPALERHMHLSITPIKANNTVAGFLFQNTLLSAVRRPPFGIFAFANEPLQTDDGARRPLVGVCSFCQRVSTFDENADDSVGTDEWLSAEMYYQRGGVSDVRVSHAICADCSVSIYSEFKPVAERSNTNGV